MVNLSQNTRGENYRMEYDWKEIIGRLNSLLHLRSTPIGIKVYEKEEAMENVPRMRRPKHIHTPCQILGQAMHLGFTIGFTAENVVNENCNGTVGLIPQTEEWVKGELFKGSWFETLEDAASHHNALTRTDKRSYKGIVASPLSSGRIEPDVCLIAGSPGQIFMLTSGYLRTEFRPLVLTFPGESTCSITWVKTLQTGEIGLSLPCFGEIRYAGFSDNEVILTMQPSHLVKAIAGAEDLSKAGLRYPIPPYGPQMDVREGLGY
jgi:uncharacterized protein (DUF169 family)